MACRPMPVGPGLPGGRERGQPNASRTWHTRFLVEGLRHTPTKGVSFVAAFARTREPRPAFWRTRLQKRSDSPTGWNGTSVPKCHCTQELRIDISPTGEQLKRG